MIYDISVHEGGHAVLVTYSARLPDILGLVSWLCWIVHGFIGFANSRPLLSLQPMDRNWWLLELMFNILLISEPLWGNWVFFLIVLLGCFGDNQSLISSFTIRVPSTVIMKGIMPCLIMLQLSLDIMWSSIMSMTVKTQLISSWSLLSHTRWLRLLWRRCNGKVTFLNGLWLSKCVKWRRLEIEYLGMESVSHKTSW